ncbi:fetuin-B-like [Megalops cyprinoides]|uniref:fetuin-B-like n=1 Tax=Megalops cyprinoides TaxID=118141 RepID=UPI0018644643|nr:fetuin-B-like [Megalops cyprinoides]
MKQCWLLLLVFVCAHGAPTDLVKPGSCEDPDALGAAEKALTKINQNREEGYIFSLHRLSNVNQMKHGPSEMVYYLTLDVLETKCHVLSKRNWSSCEVRQTHETPVYGQCKATIYVDKVRKVVRLYTYSCSVRPAPGYKIVRLCPDCPSKIPVDGEKVRQAVQMSLEKYNSESGQANYFALLNITRASFQGGFGMFYFAEFTIQETVCANTTDIAEASKCALMDCKFAHKGLCKGSHTLAQMKEYISANCEIFEPEDCAPDLNPPSKRPRGDVRYLPAVARPVTPTSHPDEPMTIPSFPDESAAPNPGHPVTLPIFPDTEGPEGVGPVILPFPTDISPQCPSQPKSEHPFIKALFSEDPLFHHTIDIVG